MKLDSFDEGPKFFSVFRGVVVAAAARPARMLLVDWFVLGPRKRRGWECKAVLRSERDWWRWSERISGEHWRRLLMLSASSMSAFATSAERRMQGSLKRVRTVLGVWISVCKHPCRATTVYPKWRRAHPNFTYCCQGIQCLECLGSQLAYNA